MVEIDPGQDIPKAISRLRQMGVKSIRVDRMRGVGRAGSTELPCNAGELCGRCAIGRAAIDPDGNVFPCVFSRWLCGGNVENSELGQVLLGEEMLNIRRDLAARFAAVTER
jgi:Iron-sulfur cluster-binding domain